jgi:hypothetical protein
VLISNDLRLFSGQQSVSVGTLPRQQVAWTNLGLGAAVAL